MDLPKGFMEQFAPLGIAALDSLPQALAGEPSVAIRYNRYKGGVSCTADSCEPVPWCRDGRYLGSRPMFTLDPALHQGLYYVQDASSMFIAHVVEHLTADGLPVRYLDACASPGGKITAAVNSLPEGSIAVANEYLPARATILRENIIKWGVPVAVYQGDVCRFAADGAAFDIIAADVPCSGEGMMRKDPKAIEQWSVQLVEECAARQRQIIDALWPALSPGGFLIYSTCTFNTTENEAMINYMTSRYGAMPTEIPCDPGWGILPAIGAPFPAYRFIPGRIRGEGLFMAVVRKPEDRHPQVNKNRDKEQSRRSRKETKIPAEVRQWIRSDCHDDIGIQFQTNSHGNITARMSSRRLRLPYAPEIEIAAMKGRDLIPSHALAMSTLFQHDNFQKIDISTDLALDYLRCQTIALPASAPRGIILLTHADRPLGFAKNIGSRANNLYPRAWRILK